MRAIWKNKVIAESDKTLQIEGNHYFPKESVSKEFLQESDMHTICPWKGEANYFNIVVDGEVNADAAWYYPNPKAGSPERVAQWNNGKGNYANYIAFWRGVDVAD